MSQVKRTYYIDLGSGGISPSPSSSAWNYKIEADNEEITALREEFELNHREGTKNFLRAHIPFKEYHNDKENDLQDASLARIFRMIHKLGDEEARKHIESMGILD